MTPLIRRVVVATVVTAALLVAEAQPGFARGKVFHVSYSGTVTETAQPYGREGNSYSESITFSLTRNGTLEQLAHGTSSDELTASGQLSADMANKPPEVPPSSCSGKVSVGGGVPTSEILAVGQDGSAGAQLTALLADLTPQAAGRSDLCWVDSDFQWLKDGADPGAGFNHGDAAENGHGTRSRGLALVRVLRQHVTQFRAGRDQDPHLRGRRLRRAG